jgi:hypothetical protein
VSAAFFYVHNVGPLFIAAIWLGSARWVHLDAQSRLRNPSGVRAATVAAIAVPFVGAALWGCARPCETLVERRERRLLRLLREEELRGLDELPERRVERRRAEPQQRETTARRLAAAAR